MPILARACLKGSISPVSSLSGEVNLGNDKNKTFILIDEKGNEVPAVVVDERVIFTATENDIRLGAIAVTEKGVTVGKKEIPAYHTTEGIEIIPAGAVFSISGLPRYKYTKMQALMCDFNRSIANSTATHKVSMNGKVYAVASSEAIASITIEEETKTINFNVMNDKDKPCILRYFTYKEEN